MRETIYLHIGGAGNRLGERIWELYASEHGIQPNGFRSWHPSKVRDDAFLTAYRETGAGKYIPRALFIDTDSSTLDSVRGNRRLRQTIHPDQCVRLRDPDSVLSSSQGRRNGAVVADECSLDGVMERIRRLAEDCTGLQGFHVVHSLAGAAGSGITRNLLERLSVEYGKKSKVAFSLFPSFQSSESVEEGSLRGEMEECNALWSLSCLVEHVDVDVVYQNDAVRRRIPFSSSVGWSDMNSMIAMAVSMCTTASRFDGALNVDLTEFQTGLVPYPRFDYPFSFVSDSCPRIHFLPISIAPRPLLQRQSIPDDPGTREMTFSLFDPFCCLANVDHRAGKFMRCCLSYRGDFVPREINSAIADLKESSVLTFVDWAPCGFKCGINRNKTRFLTDDCDVFLSERLVSAMSDTSAIGEQVFGKMLQQAEESWALPTCKRSFDEAGFSETFGENLENIRSLVLDYHEIALDYCESDGEEFSEEETEDGGF